MATVAATSQAMSVSNFASGSFTSDNTITEVTLGFKPRYFKMFNATDVIAWEKFEGMATANCIKTVTAGTTTNDATSAITIGDKSVSLTAAAVGNAKAISWVALA
jgi:hypothetical protein